MEKLETLHIAKQKQKWKSLSRVQLFATPILYGIL